MEGRAAGTSTRGVRIGATAVAAGGCAMATVKHVLERKGSAIYSIEPEDPVLEAIELMAEKHVGALLVMRGPELLGIVSERDYARKVILLGRSSAETPVWQIMSSPVITVAPEQTINDCLKI